MLSVPENRKCTMSIFCKPSIWLDEDDRLWPSKNGDKKPFTVSLALDPGSEDIAIVWPKTLADAIASGRPAALRVPDAEGMAYLLIDDDFSSYLSKDCDHELGIGIREFATDLLNDIGSAREAWYLAGMDEQTKDWPNTRRQAIGKAIAALASALGVPDDR